MNKYLITYHNGQMPSDAAAAEQAKKAFGKWLQEAGQAVADPGAPVIFTSQVTSNPSPKIEIGGYSIIQAVNDDDVVKVLKTHPFVVRGGTLQVSKIVSI